MNKHEILRVAIGAVTVLAITMLILNAVNGFEPESATAPVTEPATAPVTEPATAAVTEPTTAPATEPTTAAVTEPTTAPATEPTTAPVTEPATAPATEPTTAPATEPVTAAVTEPTTEQAEIHSEDDYLDVASEYVKNGDISGALALLEEGYDAYPDSNRIWDALIDLTVYRDWADDESAISAEQIDLFQNYFTKRAESR